MHVQHYAGLRIVQTEIIAIIAEWAVTGIRTRILTRDMAYRGALIHD